MAKPKRPVGHRALTDELLAQRIVFDAVWTFAWRALSRYGFTDADRKDIAQNVVFAAWRGRAGYRGDRGNPEQWLSTILRNEVRDFMRRQRKEPLAIDPESLLQTPSENRSPEESVSLRSIADLVFAILPEDERRAVIDIAIEGYS